MPRFLFFSFFASFLFHFLLFPSISIDDDMGATSGGFFLWIFLFIFLACFQMGFYFVTTGWIFEIGLRVNSINQSIKMAQIPTPWREVLPPPSNMSLTLPVPGFFWGSWSLFPDVLSLLSCFA